MKVLFCFITFELRKKIANFKSKLPYVFNCKRIVQLIFFQRTMPVVRKTILFLLLINNKNMNSYQFSNEITYQRDFKLLNKSYTCLATRPAII